MVDFEEPLAGGAVTPHQVSELWPDDCVLHIPPVNALAVADPQLGAGVAYYGRQPPADQVPAIRAPLLLHYAGLDEGVNAGIPAYEAALKAAGARPGCRGRMRLPAEPQRPDV